MAFTYQPGATDRDRVRFWTGDTDAGDPLLQDAEIDALLAEESSYKRAAILACRAIAAQLSRKADYRNADLAVSASQRAEAYRTLAEKLERQWGISVRAEVFAGGIERSEHEDLAQDTGARQPAFRRGQDDFPGVALDKSLTDDGRSDP